MENHSKWFRLRLRVVLIGMGAVLWAGTYAGYRLYMAYRPMPMGTGPAGPAVPRTPFNRVWTEGALWTGDSINAAGASRPHQYSRCCRQTTTSSTGHGGCDLRHVLPNLEAINYADYTTSAQPRAANCRVCRCSRGNTRIVVVTSGNDLIHDYGRSAGGWGDVRLYRAAGEGVDGEPETAADRAWWRRSTRDFRAAARFSGEHLRPDRRRWRSAVEGCRDGRRA